MAGRGPLVYLVLSVPAVLFVRRRNSQPIRDGRLPNTPDSIRHNPSVRADLDLIALSAPVPLALAKLACLASGCCYGRPSNLPWAITFPAGSSVVPGGIPLHPTQLYDMAVLLGIASVLVVLAERLRWCGTLLLWFVTTYGFGRVLTEFTRGYYALRAVVHLGYLTAFQWLCRLTSMVSMGVLVILARRRPAAVISRTADIRGQGRFWRLTSCSSDINTCEAANHASHPSWSTP